MSSEVAATRPGRGTSGHDVRARYEVAGRWYGIEDYVPNARWSPGRSTITACVDPDDSRTAVVPSVDDVTVTCGADYLGGNDVQRARPTSAPTS